MSAYKSKKLFNLFRHVAVNATLAGVLPLSSRRCCCTCTCHSGAYCYFTCLLLSLTIYYFLCALRCQHINIKFSSCCRLLLGDFWLLARCQLVKCAYFTTLWHVLQRLQLCKFFSLRFRLPNFIAPEMAAYAKEKLLSTRKLRPLTDRWPCADCTSGAFAVSSGALLRICLPLFNRKLVF